MNPETLDELKIKILVTKWRNVESGTDEFHFEKCRKNIEQKFFTFLLQIN